jgi:hypothetical protein
MNRQIVRDIVNLQRDMSSINDEIADAGLTLTRTAVQAITTAGTTIIWQSRIRGQGIAWSGSDIVIPTSGWYIITLAWRTSANLNDLYARLSVNGALVQASSAIGDVDRSAGVATFMRYLSNGNVVQINLLPSANVNLSAFAEGVAGESPILNIVQLTNQAEA